jgi:hypothetical protein
MCAYMCVHKNQEIMRQFDRSCFDEGKTLGFVLLTSPARIRVTIGLTKHPQVTRTSMEGFAAGDQGLGHNRWARIK